MVLTVLERSLLSRPQDQQAKVDRAPVQGTHPIMSRVPVVSQAQHISFCGSLSLHRPGERYWWEGGSLNKATGLPPNVTHRAENHGSALFTTDME